jgi:flagellar hook assembly protein FlgD
VRDAINKVTADSAIVSVTGNLQTKPTDFALQQNFPNPFNPTTQINYNLPKGTHVKLTIYNVQGQEIETLVNEFQTAGQKFVVWDGLNNLGIEAPSGEYFFQLSTGTFQETKKMILMK